MENKNTTITIDKELATLIRVAAARQRMSIKDFVQMMYEVTSEVRGV